LFLALPSLSRKDKEWLEHIALNEILRRVRGKERRGGENKEVQSLQLYMLYSE
jgi:hypothetical protein